jgi:hypothetical protein
MFEKALLYHHHHYRSAFQVISLSLFPQKLRLKQHWDFPSFYHYYYYFTPDDNEQQVKEDDNLKTADE